MNESTADIHQEATARISSLVDAYSSSHSYQTFTTDIPTTTAILGGYDTNSVGFIAPVEGTHLPAVPMIPMPNDTSLYDTTTAQYATRFYAADLLLQCHQNFEDNPGRYNISTGLAFVLLKGYFNNDYDYFVVHRDRSNDLITKGKSTDLSTLPRALGGYDIVNLVQKPYSVEWFGFFCAPVSGSYTFPLQTQETGFVWFGYNSMASYNFDNIVSDYRGKTTSVNVIGGKYYPIRIQYGSTTRNYTFAVKVFRNNADVTVDTSANSQYFYSIYDTVQGTPYEPVQLFYSLVQENANTALYNCYVTKSDVTNNYEYNQQVRVAKAQPNLLYNDIVIATVDSIEPVALALREDGTLTLETADKTKSMALTQYQNYANCVGGAEFGDTKPAVLWETFPVTSYYATNKRMTNTDMETGLTYSEYVLNDFNYTSNSGDALYQKFADQQKLPANTAVKYSYNYMLGNERINVDKTDVFPAGLLLTNLDKLKNCTFTLTLGADGNLIITNPNQTVWSLFEDKKYSAIATKIQNTANTAVRNESWYNEYYDSYTYQQVERHKIRMKESVGGVQSSKNPYMISTDGKYKLLIKNNQLILRYAMRVGDLTQTYTNPLVNAYQSNCFYLITVNMDAKLGKTFLVDTAQKSLRYVPRSADILQPTDAYSRYTGPYNFPPNVSATNTRYRHYDNIPADRCAAACNAKKECGHYYTFSTNDDVQHCIINQDGLPPTYYPSQPNANINSSNLYIRGMSVHSECNVNTYTPQYAPDITADRFKGFELYDVHHHAYAPKLADEGPCGTTAIHTNVGTYYAGNKVAPLAREGFAGTGTGTGVGGVESSPEYQMLQADLAKRRGQHLPGYNANNRCTGSRMNLPECTRDMSANMGVLMTAAQQTNVQNAQLDANYNELNTHVQYMHDLYNWMHASEDYDAIDNDGTLRTTAKNQTLSDVMYQDKKQMMLEQNSQYIIINLVSATLVLAVISFFG